MHRKRLAVLLMLFVSALFVRAQDNYVMDIGFRPQTDGFSFENYGDDIGATDLTSVEMVYLFGEDNVCKDALAEDGSCTLSYQAEDWMNETNSAMGGGHCEGMAVSSLLLYQGEVETPADFGGTTTADLSIEDEYLQREIALWWATQMTEPTVASVVEADPVGIVKTLIDSMATEYFTIGIYLPDGDGGHAITPYAVEDMGDGTYTIWVYDNNYPGEERALTVDGNRNSWAYIGSTNPSEAEEEYYGDATTQNLDLTPMAPRTQVQDCPFCGSLNGEATEGDRVSINLNGRANVLLTDENGRQVGYVDGKVINEIGSEAHVSFTRNGLSSFRAPKISVPSSLVFKVTLTKSSDDKRADTVTIIRRGQVTRISGFTLVDTPRTIGVTPERIQYTSDDSETISFEQSVTIEGQFEGRLVVSGDTDDINFGINLDTGEFDIAGGSAENPLDLNLVSGFGDDMKAYTEVSLTDDAQFNPDTWTDSPDIQFYDDSGNPIDDGTDTVVTEEPSVDESGTDSSGSDAGAPTEEPAPGG